ncbi:glycosyltransferase [Paenibacillus xylaniclasticus]|uniref:glycosyltransferase n=1 Tax=Paenibacillus xylaniclasticus TaxID=588083 RepID=UPI000FDC76D2|nr:MULTISPECIES: glycosyltransferase [Paenibacillus]GFN32769.1 glycosyl transferase family 1 [Paenibacillus curdlanolyticus]
MITDKVPVNTLHIISSFQVGGAEKLLLDLVREGSASSRVSFVVVVMNDLVDEGMKQQLLATGCEVYFLNRPPSHRHPKYLTKLLKIVSKHRIDVIHSHTYGSKLWAVLCKLIKPRLKLVFTIHDTNIARRFNFIHRFIHRRIIDQNVAISNAVLQECMDSQIMNSTRIYNGIHVHTFSRFKKQSPVPDTTAAIKIVNVARITHQKKGQDILIEAIKLCKDKGLKVSCGLIGGFYEYDKESAHYLRQLIDQYNLQEEVVFYGSRNDVHKLLPEFDIFVLPSRYEGLGLVVLEAMAAGIPVISANIDGPAELIQHGENGLLFKSGDAVDLANQIMSLASSRHEAERMTENAYSYVRQFDISVMLKQYSDLYMRLVSKTGT